MTPAEHIAEAERLITLVQGDGNSGPLDSSVEDLLLAIAHAVIAFAVENGVPHASVPPAGGSGGS